MTRRIGAGLLALFTIAAVFAARRADAGANEFAAQKAPGPPLPAPEAIHTPPAQIDTRAAEFRLLGDAAMGSVGQTYLLDVMERRASA